MLETTGQFYGGELKWCDQFSLAESCFLDVNETLDALAPFSCRETIQCAEVMVNTSESGED